MTANPSQYPHQGYPVVDPAGKILGVMTMRELAAAERAGVPGDRILSTLIRLPPVTVHGRHTLREALVKMAEARVGRLLVVAEDESAGACSVSSHEAT